MMKDLSFYIAGALGLLAAVLKTPALIRARDSGARILLSAVCALLLVGSGVLVFAAPATIRTVNRVTGVDNISAPLVYVLLMGFCAASFLLIINWRGGPPERLRRSSLICVTSYALVITVMIVLFTAAEVPTEKRTTFDTYYASTPFIREMLLLYFVAHATAAFMTTALCWRWSREDGLDGTLRVGLRILTLGYLLHIAFVISKATAVAARWTGRDWDFLSTHVGPAMATPSAFLVTTGFFVPLLGGTGRALINRYRLQQLAKELAGFTAHTPLGWWPPDTQVTRLSAAISDTLLPLEAHFDPGIRARARAQAIARGEDEARAQAIAEAAMVIAASRANARGIRPSPEPRRPDVIRTMAPVALAHALNAPEISHLRTDAPIGSSRS
ncbi:DUF6545 domain-containing protein [Streptomyces sp. NPDC006984]|uniref:DUF6545 domain-containing protein n=1 Tax=Streptomyces sp. NPDC006984 TaxID=3155463 RepID=UPI0033DC47F6